MGLPPVEVAKLSEDEATRQWNEFIEAPRGPRRREPRVHSGGVQGHFPPPSGGEFAASLLHRVAQRCADGTGCFMRRPGVHTRRAGRRGIVELVDRTQAAVQRVLNKYQAPRRPVRARPLADQ